MEGSRTDIQYAYSTQQKGVCPAPEVGKGFINFEKAKSYGINILTHLFPKSESKVKLWNLIF